MHIQSLPTDLQSVAQDVIDHVHKKLPEPKGIDDLVAWFEDAGWDQIVQAWSDERVVLKLYDLAQLKFEDYEFRAHEGVEGEITDDLRITFARREIDQTLESGDGYSCPSVHAVKLEDDTNRFVFLGWMVEIHGQGGHVPIFWGIYKDSEQFHDELRGNGLLFSEEAESLTDQQILDLWQR